MPREAPWFKFFPRLWLAFRSTVNDDALEGRFIALLAMVYERGTNGSWLTSEKQLSHLWRCSVMEVRDTIYEIQEVTAEVIESLDSEGCEFLVSFDELKRQYQERKSARDRKAMERNGLEKLAVSSHPRHTKVTNRGVEAERTETELTPQSSTSCRKSNKGKNRTSKSPTNEDRRTARMAWEAHRERRAKIGKARGLPTKISEKDVLVGARACARIRLVGLDPADVLDGASEFVCSSDHHLGRNDRGKTYLGWELVCRNAERYYDQQSNSEPDQDGLAESIRIAQEPGALE